MSHALSDATAGNCSAVTQLCHLASRAESADDVKERGSSSDTKVQTKSDKHYLMEEKGGRGDGHSPNKKGRGYRKTKGERKISAAGTLLWAEFSVGFASAKHILYS